MAGKSVYSYMTCGCEPEPRAISEDECDLCTPRLELTAEEETILATMRSIKERVRPISERLSELHEQLKHVPDEKIRPEARAEWEDLALQLSNFREQWKKWQGKLDEATENKLVFLGHHGRPASAG
ncbi:MAG: hypothetical protein LDL33_08925 [Desulfomonile sp.]|nr:hypothetical protein [Desulfomonile sp.]